jgi:uncharacterized coiled-coil protein SlyX
MQDDIHERLNQLESHLMHVERLCEQLNQVVLEQSRQITKLMAHQQRLSESVETMELERIKANVTKPPHYQ